MQQQQQQQQQPSHVIHSSCSAPAAGSCPQRPPLGGTPLSPPCHPPVTPRPPPCHPPVTPLSPPALPRVSGPPCAQLLPCAPLIPCYFALSAPLTPLRNSTRGPGPPTCTNPLPAGRCACHHYNQASLRPRTIHHQGGAWCGIACQPAMVTCVEDPPPPRPLLHTPHTTPQPEPVLLHLQMMQPC
jgi:hypothetical protein